MIEFWHNPRCSKSRQALTLLRDRGVEVRERRYLDTPPSLDEIAQIRAALGQPRAIDMMRPGEKLFRDLGLDRGASDEVLMQAMADHPILIERPVAIAGARAVIGRPPERVLDLI
ncbi:arsenate reductase (glutaredoxin) [Sedimentitalea sp. JM2-8]|uniref:Arsenate reductase n=1 Tax=Sedimentitalea xiamensis TaxID=3050037 RepID=A0ABT7FIB7_9RHOB|nr:arsenate reductase (glutaredoxin) [Sedimentitalea xiamensis]MDK3074875.1 arsenate reductase (glutaredoxin) [Sedimentitalea xiamensis]